MAYFRSFDQQVSLIRFHALSPFDQTVQLFDAEDHFPPPLDLDNRKVGCYFVNR